jgi:hypothetical protein
MSLLIPGEGAWEHVWGGIGAVDCFLCGDPIPRQEVAVHWGGATADITFHPECATSFVLRLARDCWEYGNASWVAPGA